MNKVKKIIEKECWSQIYANNRHKEDWNFGQSKLLNLRKNLVRDLKKNAEELCHKLFYLSLIIKIMYLTSEKIITQQ